MVIGKRYTGGFSKLIIVMPLFVLVSFSSMAWGVLGHRIVGGIADTYLTGKARQAVKQILGSETLSMAANWADFIKSDTTYKYLNTWHYIDFDSSVVTYSQMLNVLKEDTGANAYTRLNFLIKQLKDKNLPGDKKVMYLRLLIHIAGDVHQPFHVSQKGDNGGNGIKATWFGAPTNMHRVWDEQLIEFQQLSYTEYITAINFTTLQQRKLWQKDPLPVWLFESYVISGQLRKQLTYPEPKLSYFYNFQNVKTLNEQLLKAGVRLAGLLNTIFV